MMRRSDGVVIVPGFLWTNEPAWKIRAEFARSQPAPAELWTVKGVALPPPGSYGEINLRTQIHDVPLVLNGIAGANTSFPGESTRSLKDRPRLHLEFDLGTNLFEFSLRQAIDQKGRRIQSQPSSVPRGQRAFSLQTLPDSTNLDLTFALRRNYVLDFVAKPTLLSTNLDHWPKRAAVAE